MGNCFSSDGASDVRKRNNSIDTTRGNLSEISSQRTPGRDTRTGMPVLDTVSGSDNQRIGIDSPPELLTDPVNLFPTGAPSDEPQIVNDHLQRRVSRVESLRFEAEATARRNSEEESQRQRELLVRNERKKENEERRQLMEKRKKDVAALKLKIVELQERVSSSSLRRKEAALQRGAEVAEQHVRELGEIRRREAVIRQELQVAVRREQVAADQQMRELASLREQEISSNRERVASVRRVAETAVHRDREAVAAHERWMFLRQERLAAAELERRDVDVLIRDALTDIERAAGVAENTTDAMYRRRAKAQMDMEAAQIKLEATSGSAQRDSEDAWRGIGMAQLQIASSNVAIENIRREKAAHLVRWEEAAAARVRESFLQQEKNRAAESKFLAAQLEADLAARHESEYAVQKQENDSFQARVESEALSKKATAEFQRACAQANFEELASKMRSLQAGVEGGMSGTDPKLWESLMTSIEYDVRETLEAMDILGREISQYDLDIELADRDIQSSLYSRELQASRYEELKAATEVKRERAALARGSWDSIVQYGVEIAAQRDRDRASELQSYETAWCEREAAAERVIASAQIRISTGEQDITYGHDLIQRAVTEFNEEMMRATAEIEAAEQAISLARIDQELISQRERDAVAQQTRIVRARQSVAQRRKDVIQARIIAARRELEAALQEEREADGEIAAAERELDVLLNRETVLVETVGAIESQLGVEPLALREDAAARLREIETQRQQATDELENLRNSLNCIICLAVPKCMMVEPCNHLVSCETCSGQFGSGRAVNKCPQCRRLIAQMKKVFL